MLGFDKGKNLALELGDEARQDWAYWPTERVGVPLDLMNGEQRRLTHRLLTSLLSARGYLKVVQIMQLEQILGMLDTAGLPRGVGHYEVVLFGKPSLDGGLVVALRRSSRVVERRRRAGGSQRDAVVLRLESGRGAQRTR